MTTRSHQREPLRTVAGPRLGLGLGIGLALALALAATGPAAAQRAGLRAKTQAKTQVNPPPVDAGPRPDHRRLGLEPRPLAVESLGLQFHPPLGATFTQQRIQNRVTVNLIDGADVPTWSVRVQSITPNIKPTTPEQQIEQMIERWQAGDRPPTVISNEAVSYGGRDGQLCFVRQEVAAGEHIISGWLMLPLEDDDLLTFAIQTLPADFSSVRVKLEASFSTIDLKPLTDVAMSRKRRLDAGQAFLASLNEQRLRTLVDRERWYRYYMPAGVDGSQSERELGYYLVEFSEGKLGEIDPSKSDLNYDPSEQTLGLLVHVHGHSIDVTTQTTYDSQAYYWMAWDQSEEAWSIRGTRRFQGKALSEAMTGIRTPKRTGNPTGKLTVINSGMNAAHRDEKSWRVPDVYLSQALRWALGYLLPRDKDNRIEMSSYCFDNTAARLSLSLRIDEWGPAPSGLGWKLESRARSDAPNVVSLYDRNGELTTRRWPDGPVTERIELKALHRLWKSKGLPTGEFGR